MNGVEIAILAGARKLEDILGAWAEGAIPDLMVSGLAVDSRLVNPGDLFLAARGVAGHGLEYAADAVERGAVAIAWEPTPNLEELGNMKLPLIRVPTLNEKLGEIASQFYGNPTAQLHVIGVTGTNGKTSVAHFLAQAISSGSEPCGLIGTLGLGIYGRTRRSTNTTPGALDNQKVFAEIAGAGAHYGVLEVSSHALHQSRTKGVKFATAVFTNLSHDHLDYHGSMDKYSAAKKILFDRPELQHRIINVDDEVGRAWVAEYKGRPGLFTYSVAEGNPHSAGVWAEGMISGPMGIRFKLHTPWGSAQLEARVLGSFNVQNLLAAASVLGANGWAVDEIASRLCEVSPVPGRMEAFRVAGRAGVVVDYAHTPDALEQALITLRSHVSGKLICVFGCGGDRDIDKRPVMGAVAEKYADLAIITDDNPRYEQPAKIAQDIQYGLKAADRVPVIHDRAEAIRSALEFAEAKDCVLVAGKGHEEYQLIGGERFRFSDRQQVQRLLVGEPE